MSLQSFALPSRAPTVELSDSQRAWLVAGGITLGLFVGLMASLAFAGTGGEELQPIWQMLTDFIKGTLGRIITLLIIIVGITAGILTQSLGAFAVGLGAGIGLYFSPQIIESLFSATLMLPIG